MTKNNMHTLVIGGGPAGMTAAIAAADAGDEVTLIERNEKLGKKLYITGKGRCNLTNICDDEVFFKNVVHNGRFLFSAMSRFNRWDLMGLIEDNGCPLKTERGGRVFPVSDKSSDVIKAYKKALDTRGVNIEYNAKVTDLNSLKTNETVRITGVKLSDGRTLDADKIILAAGGNSYRQTGSDGNGYAFAKALGHHIVAPRPSLIGLVCRENWPGELSGLTLKNVDVMLLHHGKKIKCLRGEVLLTHFGLSGPVILTMSAYCDDNPKNYTLSIDLKPALTDKQLDARILRDFEQVPNKKIDNALKKLLPVSLITVVRKMAGIDAEIKVNALDKASRKRLVYQIKNLTFHITDFFDPNTAIVTSGGIDTREINPKSMASKLVDGLYFAGEIIDVDAVTGGFNIQIAASTGFAAGSH